MEILEKIRKILKNLLFFYKSAIFSKRKKMHGFFKIELKKP